MTDLTEQWKKGELPDDEYYCRTTHDSGVHKHYLSNIDNENMIEILAPVPSYEEYLESESHCVVMRELYDKVKEENAQLKELLKEWIQFETEENPNDFTVMSERMSELANKTKEALK